MEAFCRECRKLIEAALIIHLDPQGFQGVFMRCAKENTYCIYCRSQLYLTEISKSNRERVIREYHKKSR